MNWYLETELIHGSADQYDMKESFILTVSFHNGFHCIDDSLQEIRARIFQTPNELMTWVHPNLNMQLQHTIECYNMVAEEGEEDSRNINIPKLEGQREVAGPEVEIPNITQPINTKQVNISSEAKPKFMCIGYYQDEDTVGKVVELLHEYQELFLMNFTKLQGTVGNQGGDDPFVHTKEIDSPFIVKRRKSSVGGMQNNHKSDKSAGAKLMVLTKGDIDEIRDTI